MQREFLKFYGGRNFSESRNLEKCKPDEVKKPSSSKALEIDFIPSAIEKQMMLWSGKYKNAASLPQRISFHELENAKSRFRIRMGNWMMLGTIVLFGYYIWQGKKKAAQGETINKMYQRKSEKILAESKT